MLRLDEAEAAQRTARARDPEYWRSLAPHLHVCDPGAELESRQIDPGSLEEADKSLNDGAFQLCGVLPPASLARANAAVDAVTAAGWPAAFAFAYDELWLCGRTPALVAVVRRALGAGCGQIPHAWVHVVPPGGAGWPAHVDGPRDGRLTAWVALTDASLENGCMYVVARDAAPRRVADRIGTDATLTGAEVQRLLHGARALPARAGDMICWRFDVIHWGGRALAASAGRRGLSLEFIAAAEDGAEDERPPVPLDVLPSLDTRLRAIAGGILGYGAIEPMLRRYEQLARRLWTAPI
jgi:hypothetical protein